MAFWAEKEYLFVKKLSRLNKFSVKEKRHLSNPNAKVDHFNVKQCVNSMLKRYPRKSAWFISNPIYDA